MKQKILALLLFVQIFSAIQAQTMNVKVISGAPTAFNVANIKKLTFADGNLIVTNLTGSNVTFALAENKVIDFSRLPAGPLTFCKGATVASAGGTTTVKFYNSATAITSYPLTTLLTNRIYYVAEVVNGVESSPRIAVPVTVNLLPTEVLGAMTSNTVSATTTTGFVAATLAVGQYVGTTSAISYRIPEFIGSGLSYLWTVPAGVTIIGSSDTNVLTVHYNDVAAGVGTIGVIKVQAVNTNGCAGTAKSITVSKALPSAPGSIKMTNAALPLPLSGVAAAITTFAPYMGTDTELTLTAKLAATATSYDWELPEGVTQLSGGNTNVITVNFEGVTSSNTYNYLTNALVPVSTNVLRIGVKARNGVGVSVTSNSTLANSSLDFTPNSTSTARLLTLMATKPATPGSIKMTNAALPVAEGAVAVAVTDISKFIGTDTELTLTAAVSKLASYYSWELPETVTVVDESDLNSNSIRVTFENVPAGTTSLYLGVKAENGIGSSVKVNAATLVPATSSSATLLKVTAKAPAASGTVVGELKICAATATSQTYTITLAAAGAKTYNVTAPVGCTIVDGIANTKTIDAVAGATFTVNYPIGFIATTTVIKTITIQSVNGFGNSISNRVLKLTNTGATCSAPKFANTSAADDFNVIAYPNPSSSAFTIETSAKGVMSVRVYDMTGRIIENQQISTNTVEIGGAYTSGVYSVILENAGQSKTIRLIKK